MSVIPSIDNNSFDTTDDNDYSLTPITTVTELRDLRDLYLQDWPTHIVGYYTLDNFIRWLVKDTGIKNLHVFTLNGDWRSEGTFLIVDRYQLFVNSLNHSNNDRLTKVISLLDWAAGYKVSSFLEFHRPAVRSVVDALQLQVEYDSLTVMYYLPCEEALKFDIDCPEEYYVREMSVDDAAITDAHWPNRHQGSLFLLRRLIAWNPNIGVYVKGTDELVAWCFRLQGGFLGALQVKDSHKRKGLGSLATRAISRKIAQQLGHDVTALVNPENIASRRMFEKLGFKLIGTAFWLRTFPTKEALTWPDGR